MVINVCDRTSALGRIQEMLTHLSANFATVNFRVNFLIWRSGAAVIACTRAPPWPPKGSCNYFLKYPREFFCVKSGLHLPHP